METTPDSLYEMDDLSLRLKRCTRHITNSSLPKYKRVVKGLRVFQGLELTDLEPGVKAGLEQSLLQVNEILHPYQFESYDDYKNMSDADLSRMLRIKIRMCKNLGNLIADYSNDKSG